MNIMQKYWLLKNIESNREVADRTKNKDVAIACEKFIRRYEMEVRKYEEEMKANETILFKSERV